MAQTGATQRGIEQAPDKNTVRPFTKKFPEAELTELRRRINATQWPERETVTDAIARRTARDDCRHSRAIGRRITTGAKSRRD